MDKFGFVAHPIERSLMRYFLGAWKPMCGIMPEKALSALARLRGPRILSTYREVRSSSGRIVGGAIVGVPLTPIDIMSMDEELALDFVMKAVALCARRGAQIVGLGGFTSIIGDEGSVLNRRSSVPVTSGNTMTASLARDAIDRAAHLMEIDVASSVVAVLGATGDIGSACARVLAGRAAEVRLVARSEERLARLERELAASCASRVSIVRTAREAAAGADIVLSATSALTTIIDHRSLKSGAVVCDVSLPASIAREVAANRDDVLAFEGGLARLPYTADLRTPGIEGLLPGTAIYGCIAETVALAFERRFEPFSIGRGTITVERIAEMREIARAHGITVADFFGGSRFYTDDEVARIRTNAKMGKTSESSYAR